MQVVINRGMQHGVKDGDLYLIYVEGPEIFDPETNESLGTLELIRGRGRVIHRQDRMSTIQCVRQRPRDSLEKFFGIGLTAVSGRGGDAEENSTFKNVSMSDLARPIAG